MSAKKDHNYFVFTPYGAFESSGSTVKIALARFLRINPHFDILGIIRADLVTKPPRGPGAKPFICSIIQGELQPKPNPEGAP